MVLKVLIVDNNEVIEADNSEKADKIIKFLFKSGKLKHKLFKSSQYIVSTLKTWLNSKYGWK